MYLKKMFSFYFRGITRKKTFYYYMDRKPYLSPVTVNMKVGTGHLCEASPSTDGNGNLFDFEEGQGF